MHGVHDETVQQRLHRDKMTSRETDFDVVEAYLSAERLVMMELAASDSRKTNKQNRSVYLMYIHTYVYDK